MPKRFTDTEKWMDEKFSELQPNTKLVYLFILDNCDNAGFFKINTRINSFLIGLTTDEYLDAIKCLGSSFWLSTDRKMLWNEKFIYDQKNTPLNPSNNAHKQIIQILTDNQEHFKNKFTDSPKLGAYKGLASPIGKGKGNGIGKGSGNTKKRESWQDREIRESLERVRANKESS